MILFLCFGRRCWDLTENALTFYTKEYLVNVEWLLKTNCRVKLKFYLHTRAPSNIFRYYVGHKKEKVLDLGILYVFMTCIVQIIMLNLITETADTNQFYNFPFGSRAETKRLFEHMQTMRIARSNDLHHSFVLEHN